MSSMKKLDIYTTTKKTLQKSRKIAVMHRDEIVRYLYVTSVDSLFHLGY